MSRFKDLGSPKSPNRFKRPKKSNRWANLNDEKKDNKFKPTPNTNGRWSNLKFDNDNRNSFQKKRFVHKKKKSGIFANAKMVNGVPQVKGSINKNFNIMDVIKIKEKPKKTKTKKKKTPKNMGFMKEEKEKTEEKTEKEKKQEALWKQQLLQQYQYESMTDEEDIEEDNTE